MPSEVLRGSREILLNVVIFHSQKSTEWDFRVFRGRIRSQVGILLSLVTRKGKGGGGGPGERGTCGKQNKD